MPDWLVAVLLVVFAVHLILFARLAFRRRQGYYIAVAFTFALLVVAFSLRLGWPEILVGELELYWLFRWAAWASAAVSISWLLIRKLQAGV